MDTTTTLLLLGKATLLLAAALVALRALSDVNPRWRLLVCELAAVAVLLLPLAALWPVVDVAVPLPAAPAPETPLAIEMPPLAADPGLKMGVVVAAPEVTSAVGEPTRSFPVGLVLVTLYAAGVLGFVLYRLAAKRRLRVAVAFLPEANARAQTVLDEMLDRHAVASRPQLLAAPEEVGPFCCRSIEGGAIIVPETLADAGDPDAIEAVLHHELQHLANRDLLRLGLMGVFNALLWFHPLAWLLRGRHAATAEELGDRVAAGHVGRERYRSTLARLALTCSEARSVPVDGLGFFRTPEILGRLRKLSHTLPHAPIGRRRIAGAIGLALALTLPVAGLRFAEAQGAPEEPAASEPADVEPVEDGPIEDEQKTKVADSVRRAFNAILANQDDDGGVGMNKTDDANKVALTALAATAMRSHGGADKASRLHEPMAQALSYVLKCQRETGVFYPTPDADRAGSMYHHFIATWCVASMIDLVPKAERREARKRLKLAVKVILNAQSVKKVADASGGWRYTPKSRDSDLSCSAWGLRALVAARAAKIKIPPKAFNDAVDYVKRTQNLDGGFRYVTAGGAISSIERAGMGLYCLLVGRGAFAPDDLEPARKAAAYMVDNIPADGAKLSPYHHYGIMWCAAALAHAEPDKAKPYLEWMVPHCLETQGNCTWQGSFGPIFHTLCVLHAYAPSL